MTGDNPAQDGSAQSHEPRPTTLADYAWSVLLVAATTAVAIAVRTLFALPDMEILFLLGVMLAATLFGRGPTVLAAALSVAVYDFFFVPPFFTFAVADFRYVLTFAMMFGIGIVISTLIDRLRRQQSAAMRAAVRAETEELRSALLSSVSHDLRTPLAVITGAATTLRDDPGLSPTTRGELLDTVCEEAERLERLLVNLLDMTRLESGVALTREWIPLVEVLGGALVRVERRLPAERVTTAIPDDLPLVPVDAVLMEQLFVNLLENAAKYTPPVSPVDIRAWVREGSVIVEVCDRGPGIAAEHEKRVFERFTRGRHPGVPGVGLGLPIARAIAIAHGGTLTVSARAGGGARFTLVIPIVGVRPQPVEESS
jgi:K+-sensing histidine kinase KdpD